MRLNTVANEEQAQLESLLEDLTKPIYVWRMARNVQASPGTEITKDRKGIIRSAQTRRRNALNNIATILAKHGYTRSS